MYTGLRQTAISTLRQPKFLAAVASLAVLFGGPHWFTINRTASSAPRGIYLRTHRKLRQGELVEACLPHHWALFAVSRAYIRGSGRCSDNTEPIIKEIVGMPGQIVWSDPASILPTDSGGRDMPQQYPGWYRLRPGEIWLTGSARNSFDSRYVGPLPISSVTAVLEPLWTW